MVIDADNAASVLSDVARVELRTRQAVRNWISSSFLIMWGALTALGNVGQQYWPNNAGPIWLAIMIVGTLGGFVIVYFRARTTRRAPREMRLIYASLIFIVFNMGWACLLVPLAPREMTAFGPSLFMMGFVVAGLWFGRFFILCGVAALALIFAGYFWTGEWFNLWLAAVEGIGLVAGGLYLRRVGVEP